MKESSERHLANWPAECGRRVAERRAQLGWHRRQLADEAETTEATIGRIESGALNPSDEMRVRVATALGCQVAELWHYPTIEGSR